MVTCLIDNDTLLCCIHYEMGEHSHCDILLQKSDLPEPSLPSVLPKSQQAMSRFSAFCVQVSGEEPSEVQVRCKHQDRGCQCCYWRTCSPAAAARCTIGGMSDAFHLSLLSPSPFSKTRIASLSFSCNFPAAVHAGWQEVWLAA